MLFYWQLLYLLAGFSRPFESGLFGSGGFRGWTAAGFWVFWLRRNGDPTLILTRYSVPAHKVLDSRRRIGTDSCLDSFQRRRSFSSLWENSDKCVLSNRYKYKFAHLTRRVIHSAAESRTFRMQVAGPTCFTREWFRHCNTYIHNCEEGW